MARYKQSQDAQAQHVHMTWLKALAILLGQNHSQSKQHYDQRCYTPAPALECCGPFSKCSSKPSSDSFNKACHGRPSSQQAHVCSAATSVTTLPLSAAMVMTAIICSYSQAQGLGLQGGQVCLPQAPIPLPFSKTAEGQRDWCLG